MSVLPLRRHVLPVAVALGYVIGMVACGQLNDQARGVESLGTSSSGTSSGGGASSGSSQDASIDITADGGEDGVDPLQPFEHLCEQGGCNPDDGSARCQDGGSGGGGEVLTCKLTPTEMGVEGVCTAVGTKLANEVCQTAADCAEGLGCEATSMKCRPYCCGLIEDCPLQTYCAEVAMAEDPEANRPVPMCIPVKDCALLDDSTCAVGETCSIVREDGTTSCIPAGTGTTCAPCPCAQGYICSKGLSVCLKLCHTNRSNECGLGFCQGGASNYPADIGVCVGGEADDCAP